MTYGSYVFFFTSLSFDLLNPMIHWSRWPVDQRRVIEQRCYIHFRWCFFLFFNNLHGVQRIASGNARRSLEIDEHVSNICLFVLKLFHLRNFQRRNPAPSLKSKNCSFFSFLNCLWNHDSCKSSTVLWLKNWKLEVRERLRKRLKTSTFLFPLFWPEARMTRQNQSEKGVVNNHFQEI